MAVCLFDTYQLDDRVVALDDDRWHVDREPNMDVVAFGPAGSPVAWILKVRVRHPAHLSALRELQRPFPQTCNCRLKIGRITAVEA